MQPLSLRILQILNEEHLKMVGLLERLEGFFEKHGPDQMPGSDDTAAKELLVELRDIMETEIDHHYDFEEKHLFPRFMGMGGEGIADMLKDEHDAIRPLAISLRKQLEEALENGFSEDTWRQFHALGTEMAEREIFHIQKEEMGFLPGLQQMLNPSDDQPLLDAYAKIKGET